VPAATLDNLVTAACDVDGVWARDVCAGDRLVVRTKNSIYSLFAGGDGTFVVAGGWFAAHGTSWTRVGVAGCTWGGHAILTGVVAVVGMCLEFDNGVRTTRIREVRFLRDTAQPTLH
jgi:hypothetical protein